MKLKLGFSGSRHGMNYDGALELENDLSFLFDIFDQIELHHGDCVGADCEMHILFEKMSLVRNRMDKDKIVIHPPTKDEKRAFCAEKKYPCVKCVVLDPKPYLERDHDIVDACDFLMATPKSLIEEKRSGTWATIRYARKQNKKMRIYG